MSVPVPSYPLSQAPLSAPQVLALLTMEAPVSLHPDDIRDEKVKALRCIAPAGVGDCVLGQYVADKVGAKEIRGAAGPWVGHHRKCQRWG